uniref:Uncharacterized protein n=1 Tax=Rhizophora mucronata TaxID=61149 RepID=A0A2P2QM33_RHIMU
MAITSVKGNTLESLLHFLNSVSVLYVANINVGAEILALLVLIIKHMHSDSSTVFFMLSYFLKTYVVM